MVGEGKPISARWSCWTWRSGSASRATRACVSTDPSGEKREKAEKFVAARIAERLHAFPGYAQVRKVALLTERCSSRQRAPTATLKPRRNVILERYKDRLADLYKGHGGLAPPGLGAWGRIQTPV